MKYAFLYDYIEKWFTSPIWYIRTDYISRILAADGSNTIKILSGMRRVGKSYILRQIISHLLGRGVSIANILYIHTEDERLSGIDVSTLRDIWETYLSTYTPTGTIYLMLDEIQNIPNWEKLIRSLTEQYAENIQIYITGSNSNLLSSELSTVLTGRYIEYTIYPLSYTEYLGMRDISVSTIDPRRYSALAEYIQYGGLPEMVRIPDTDTRKNYILSLVQSIIFRDVVQRYSIKKTQFLETLLRYIYTTTCTSLSIQSILRYLRQDIPTLDYETLDSYIGYLRNTYLIQGIGSIGTKTKTLLKWKNKFYAVDTGIRSIYSGNTDIEKSLETLVYIELCRRGYTVTSREWPMWEIDFFAQKENDTQLIQVCYTLVGTDTYAREIRPLRDIRESYPQTILTMDIWYRDDAGIHILHVADWLLGTIG
jgi:predicted AAA+ superfamily ATPase